MIRHVLAVVVSAALVGVSASTLGWLMNIDGWGRAATVGVGAAAIMVIAGRALTTWRVWPSLAAAAAGLVAVARVEVSDQLTWTQTLHPSTIPLLRERLDSVLEVLRTSAPPSPAVPGLAFGVGSLIVLAFVFTEALAVATESPVLAGIAVLCLWLPVILIGVPVPPNRILATIALFVALVAVCARPDPPPVQASTIPLTAAMIAGTLILASFAAPAALSVPTPDWLATLPRTGVNARLDLGLNVREDLVRGSNAPVLRYSGITPAELGPVHSHTLTDFDGTQWLREVPDQDFVLTEELFPSGAFVSEDAGATAPVEFSIDDIGQDRLFLPDGPRRALRPLAYDPDRDEAVSENTGSVRYSLIPLPRPTDPDFWRGQSSQTFGDAALALPPSSHIAEIRTLASQVTAGALTPYDKAVAIEQFLRSNPHFTYTTSLPAPVTTDSVFDFLDDGRGYCVQFATAMVIMARAVGVPARMAVGYLPGEPTEANGVPGGIVSSHDAHTWPQLYFGQAGWLRFEPTPAVRAPLGSLVTAPDSEPGQAEVPPSQTAAAELSTSPVPTTAQAPPSAGTETGTGTAPNRVWWPWLALVVVVTGLAALLWRRRHLAVHPATVPAPTLDDYWARAQHLLAPFGLAVDPALTPLQVRARATGLSPHRRHGSEPAISWEETVAPFVSLTAAVVATRYEPPPGEPHPEDQLADALRWTRELEENLRAWEPIFPTHEAPGGGAKPATEIGAGAAR